MEADTAVGIGAWSTVFQVSPDGCLGSGQLAAYLVVPAGVEVYFEQSVAFGAGYLVVVEYGAFAAGHFAEMGIGFVLPFVAGEVVYELHGVARAGAGCGLRGEGYDGVIGLSYLSVPEEFAHPRQGFAGAGKYYNAADGAVEPVDYAEEYLAGLGVFFLDVAFYGVAQGAVAGLVALYDFACGLVHDNQVVVLVEYVHWWGGVW